MREFFSGICPSIPSKFIGPSLIIQRIFNDRYRQRKSHKCMRGNVHIFPSSAIFMLFGSIVLKALSHATMEFCTPKMLISEECSIGH